MINIDNQRLRNLTTGILHTDISHVYADILKLTGEKIYTHEITDKLPIIQAWLRTGLHKRMFWNNKLDQTHIGITNISRILPFEIFAKYYMKAFIVTDDTSILLNKLSCKFPILEPLDISIILHYYLQGKKGIKFELGCVYTTKVILNLLCKMDKPQYNFLVKNIIFTLLGSKQKLDNLVLLRIKELQQ